MIPARQYRHVYTLGLVAAMCFAVECRKETSATIQNAAGVRLSIAEENTQPALRVSVPGASPEERTFEILFPEHVTARAQNHTEVEHLYMFRPGRSGEQPTWRQTRNSLEYERDFGGVHFLARATLEDDGLKIHYEFVNRSAVNYATIFAVTDPRMTGVLHDVRLERTYVHHKEGFDLLASETPDRFTMPLNRWLPARYLASFTWPVASQRVEHHADGITFYNKLRPVDQPMIATLSSDRKWVVASFTRTTAMSGATLNSPASTWTHRPLWLPVKQLLWK